MNELITKTVSNVSIFLGWLLLSAYRVKLLATLPAPLAADEEVIICPGLAGLPRHGLEVAALLPIAGINDRALSLLESGDPFADASQGSQQWSSKTTLALMMADPFLRAQALFEPLRRQKIQRITNYPTIQLHDGDSMRGFESASLGLTREVEIMAAFCEAGFRGTAFVTSLNAARLMLQAGADTLILHPGLYLRDWRVRAASAKLIDQILHNLRLDENIKKQILIMRPDGYGTELDTVFTQADGIVEFGF